MLLQLMVCCPQLYNTETSSSEPCPPSKAEAGATDEEGLDPSSDVEDLDDMRHGRLLKVLFLHRFRVGFEMYFCHTTSHNFYIVFLCFSLFLSCLLYNAIS